MEFAACIAQLEWLGASQGTLGMVKAFLRNRKMTMKLGDHAAPPIPINRGSPQGSVLGSMLYCAKTQSLLSPPCIAAATLGPAMTELVVEDHHEPVSPITHRPRVPRMRGERPQFFGTEELDSVEEDETADPAATVSPEQVVAAPAGDGEESLGYVKYIDDTTLIQKLPMTNAIRHCTTGTTLEEIRLQGLSGRMASLVRNAEDIGMLINCNKTQLLCLSPGNGCDTTPIVITRDGPVQLVDTLKLMGFMFGNTTDVSGHVHHIIDKFRIRIWLLYHRQEAGIKNERLFRLYCVFIRWVIEYCSPVYHSMLTGWQTNKLESLQRHGGYVLEAVNQSWRHWRRWVWSPWKPDGWHEWTISSGEQ